MIAAFLLAAALAHAEPAPSPSSSPGSEFQRALSAGKAAWKEGDCGVAEREFAIARAEAERQPDKLNLMEALEHVAEVQGALGQYEAEAKTLGLVAGIVRGYPAGDDVLGGMWLKLGTNNLHRARQKQAERELKRAIAYLEKTDDAGDLGTATMHLGLAAGYRGDLEGKVALVLKATEIFRAAGEAGALYAACGNLARGYKSLGRRKDMWNALDCSLTAAERYYGTLVRREIRDTVEFFVKELQRDNLKEKAADIGALLVQIDALPAPKAKTCTHVLTK
ncbi:MAG: hypothetical protein HY925_15895 [Elusimicrobia bacterium]|nr:hypothetical protein [Elusimicrobiota bacterium]